MKSMKNLRLILAGLLLLGFASCSDDDDNDTGGFEAGNAVQFESSITAMNLAKTNGDSWTSGDEVGVYMVKNGTTLVMGEARNKKYTADASGKLTASADAIHYPASESTGVDFIAYYPYNAALANYGYDIRLNDQTQQSKIMLLYSNNVMNEKNGSTPVQLKFSHKLTKLVFNISPGTGYTAASLTNLKVHVNGMNTAADFNLATGLISNARTNEMITALTTTDGTQSQAIVLPVSDLMYSLDFELNNGSRFEWKTSSPITLTEGKIHSFDVTIGANQVEITEGAITDWTGTGDAPTEGTGKPVVVTKYSIGDVYPKDGTPLGIVYEISNGGKNGKVVSLAEKQARWGDNTKEELTDGVALIKDVNNGKDATKNLIAKRKGAANFAGDYVIFHWLYNDLNGADENGVWYLPSKNELKGLYAAMSGIAYADIETTWQDGAAMPDFNSAEANAARTAFNDKVKAAGGTEFNFYGQYWAVTEISANVVWSVHFQTSVLQNTKSKGDGYGRARAILAF